ncbi:MAG TPA: class I SAM-dependent methyltransferase, partial [Candidatus Baltobacteraceae bacterium]|nr:class I SAM-dependent methyltransferase [Candidatus Baltobacteraceae bacterium]
MRRAAERNDYWTPERVRSFDDAIRVSNFPERVMAVLTPLLAQCRTVLDVGAGVGALTIPLARRVQSVTALDPSSTMLDALRENLKKARLRNVTTLHGKWDDLPLPSHDLVLVANVAPVFECLHSFIREVDRVAHCAVVLVQNAGPGTEKFYYGELYPLLLGRPYPRRQDYLHSLGILHGLGIYASVQIIEYNFDQPFTTMSEAMEFWTTQMQLSTLEQRRRLRRFLARRLQACNGALLAP